MALRMERPAGSLHGVVVAVAVAVAVPVAVAVGVDRVPPKT